MSFVATGLVWQWVLNPTDGIQQAVRQMGFENFTFDWIIDQDKVIYTVVVASVWQASGLVMALLLAGLRGIDEDIWKAARIDGIKPWRVYLSIVLPMLGASFATVFVLLFTAAVKVFDAVAAMTQGGPGTASDVPAKFIMDHLFGRANVALASAGAIVLLLTVLALVAPFFYARNHKAMSKAMKGRGRMSHSAIAMSQAARRAKARGRFNPARWGIYAFLLTAALFFLAPLYIMLVTSFKTMEEIRLGQLFALPMAATLEPWRAAWSEVCTGVSCEGISAGFWNSVAIVVPSTILPVFIGALNGYALSFWRPRAAPICSSAS